MIIYNNILRYPGKGPVTMGDRTTCTGRPSESSLSRGHPVHVVLLLLAAGPFAVPFSVL